MNKIFLFIFLPFVFVILEGCGSTGKEVRVASQRDILNTIEPGLIGRQPKGLKKVDRRMALKVEYRALEYNQSGEAIGWASRDGESGGTVTPGQPYQVGAQNCRHYVHSYIIKGVPNTVRGSACRSKDGSWTPLI